MRLIATTFNTFGKISREKVAEKAKIVSLFSYFLSLVVLFSYEKKHAGKFLHFRWRIALLKRNSRNFVKDLTSWTVLYFLEKGLLKKEEILLEEEGKIIDLTSQYLSFFKETKGCRRKIVPLAQLEEFFLLTYRLLNVCCRGEKLEGRLFEEFYGLSVEWRTLAFQLFKRNTEIFHYFLFSKIMNDR